MKATTLFVLLFLPFFGFSQAISSDKIIGIGQPAPYTSLASAVTYLNANGLTGNIKFLLNNDETVNSTITINQFSANSSLTIMPNPALTNNVTITANNINDWTATTSVIKFNSADNVTIDGKNRLTIFLNNNIDHLGRKVIWFASNTNSISGGCNNNAIRNVIIKQTYNQANQENAAIFSDNGNGAGGISSANTIENVIIKDSRQGIYLLGNDGTGNNSSTAWIIKNNSFLPTNNNSHPVIGFYLNNISSYEISNNTINNITRYNTQGNFGAAIYTSGAQNKNGLIKDNHFASVRNDAGNGYSYGIYTEGIATTISGNTIASMNSNSTNDGSIGIRFSGDNSQIFGNKISNIVTSTEYLTAGISLAGNNNSIFNNSVFDVTAKGGGGNFTQNGFGIVLNSGNNVKLLHNTVVLNTNQQNSTFTSAMLINSGSNLDVRNNIFVNNQTSGTRYALYSQVAPSAFTSLNYNNYRAETLSNITYGINTTSISPLFISNSSYKLQDVPANNPLKTGTPIATITTDIENVTRNTTSPTMGAFEISCVIPAISESFGNNEWNGYIFTYTEGNTNFATATYIGTLKEDKIFDRNVVAEAVNGKPGSLNIPSCITAPKDRFMIRYKMNLPISAAEAGIQNFTITGDDGYRLFVNGEKIIDKWEDNIRTSAALKNLAEGIHELVLEYYEKAGNSKIEFSYGKIKTPANNSITLPFATNDVNLPYGINQWNVYGFSTQHPDDNNFFLNPGSYAGYYVQTAMAPNTELIWNEDNAPSTTLVPNTWNGAPTHKDNFTLVYKRQGFKCGRYTLKMDKWDDAVTVFIDGVEVAGWAKNSWSGDFPSDEAKTIKTITLNANSKIEIRLKDRGSKGSMRMSLTEAPLIYNGSNLNDISNTSMTISENRNVSGQMNVCSCTVPDGKILTIKSGAILNVAEDITVIGTGKIVVENTGSLVQINNDATYTGSNSSFVLNRETTPVTRYDFTYWSSPLKTESNFILGRELPSSTGTARKGLSPQTFFDKYYLYSGQAWVAINYGAQVMVPARGYIVRAPQTYSITEAAAYNAVFEGKPNNGVIKIDVDGTNGGSNLIGNPYPSAINAQRFYDANSNLFDGTFYFWTHKAPIAQVSGGMYQYSAANYISLNQTGSTANAPTSVGEGIAGKKASVNIAAGQAFFVNTKAGLTSGQQFTFNNSMRVKEENKNSDFFRMAADENTLEDVAPAIERNRIWVNVTNATGAYNEALIGYVSGATDGYDNAFDGVTYASGTAIYTMLEGKKLVIQGKSLPFADTDVVPLGFSAATAGEYSIGLESFDGLFSAQNVYLVDKTDNSYHNIKVARYTFTSAAGTFNSRFEIRYTDDTNLGVDTPAVQDNDIVVYNSGSQIGIKATNFTLDTVQVYDITGKLLFSGKNINNSEFTTSGINVGRQMVVVKITLDGNQTLSKKVMMR